MNHNETSGGLALLVIVLLALVIRGWDRRR